MQNHAGVFDYRVLISAKGRALGILSLPKLRRPLLGGIKLTASVLRPSTIVSADGCVFIAVSLLPPVKAFMNMTPRISPTKMPTISMKLS